MAKRTPGWNRDYLRWRRYQGVPVRGQSPEERFWAKVSKTETCWLWTGPKDRHGYAMFRVGGRNGRSMGGHRFAYEHLVGPILAGLVLDHLCRVPACVRPDHLEPVTQRENLLRGDGWSGRNARRTHCPKSHAYDQANTLISGGKRFCRTCHRESDRRSHRQKGT